VRASFSFELGSEYRPHYGKAPWAAIAAFSLVTWMASSRVEPTAVAGADMITISHWLGQNTTRCRLGIGRYSIFRLYSHALVTSKNPVHEHRASLIRDHQRI